MKPERAHELMMERLYGEISSEDEIALERALRESPELAREWEEVREVRALLHDRPAAAASPEMEAAIRMAARTPPAEPRKSPWGRFAVAASVLIVMGVSAVHRFAGTLWYEESTEVALMAPQPGIAARPNVRAVPPGPASDRESLGFGMRMSESHEIQEDNRLGVATKQSQESQPNAARLASQDNASPPSPELRETEQLFRTALEVYNHAFAKVGDDREALLRSAIALLRDVNAYFPQQREWADMALLLIADAHRQLDDTDAALQACLALAERRHASDSLARQARVAAVEILIGERGWEEANRELDTLFTHFPKDSETATLALTLARRLIDEQPEAALPWLNRLQEEWPPAHPIHAKAENLRDDLEQARLATLAIRDWWVIGPLSLGALYSEVIPQQSGNPSSPLGEFVQFDGARFEWRRTEGGEKKGIDLLMFMERPTLNASAFLQTFIYSDEEQVVCLIYFYEEDGPTLHPWLNGERMSNTNWRAEGIRAHPFNGKLQAGWNRLVVKTYFDTKIDEDRWPVAVLILDEHGRIATDLTITAAPWEVEN